MNDPWHKSRRPQNSFRKHQQSPSRNSQTPGPSTPLLAPVPFENGRVLAWAALQESDRTGCFLQDTLASLEHCHQLSYPERALAVDITSSVTRRSRTLDFLIAACLARPLENTEPELLQVLRIGVCQLLFGRTPPHAAVSSTVELCRSLHRDRWTGFVNGILRTVSRLLLDQPTSHPSTSSLPTNNGQWLALNKPLLPDPSLHPAEWFGIAFSFPPSLAERWVRTLSPEEQIQAGFFFNSPPRTTLRINPLRNSRQQLQQLLESAGYAPVPGRLDSSLHLSHPGNPELLPGFNEGLWTIQDEAAQHAAKLLNPQPGESILDLCAAPGGKSTHLAELSGDHAQIIACDVSHTRLERIKQNIQRLQLSSIQLCLISREGEGIPPVLFDAALVDVPCSNTGVLHRRPEARWRFNPADLSELTTLQTRLLISAAQHLRPGGRLLYSTCSLEPEENTGVIQTALNLLPHFKLVSQILHKPGNPADGAFQALLERSP
ncbi:MAG: Ribosomal small subunit methyltransferase [Planctomycetota bacterium]